jgi:hypothetical protein
MLENKKNMQVEYDAASPKQTVIYENKLNRWRKKWCQE